MAALSVSGPVNRLGTARLADVAAACVAEGNALSYELGYRPRKEGAA